MLSRKGPNLLYDPSFCSHFLSLSIHVTSPPHSFAACSILICQFRLLSMKVLVVHFFSFLLYSYWNYCAYFSLKDLLSSSPFFLFFYHHSFLCYVRFVVVFLPSSSFVLPHTPLLLLLYNVHNSIPPFLYSNYFKLIQFTQKECSSFLTNLFITSITESNIS